jgi:hypothetical protein
MQSFLLSGPTKLTPDEEEDSRRREEADKVREDGRKKFAKEIASRVDGLRDAIRGVKGDIMSQSEFLRPFPPIARANWIPQLRWTHPDLCYSQSDAQCERPTARISSCY